MNHAFPVGVGGNSSAALGRLNALYQTVIMPGMSAGVAWWMEKDILEIGSEA